MSAACFIKKVSAAAKQVVAPFAQEFTLGNILRSGTPCRLGLHLSFWAAR